MMVSGRVSMATTMPLALYNDVFYGSHAQAITLAVVQLGVAFVILMGVTRLGKVRPCESPRQQARLLRAPPARSPRVCGECPQHVGPRLPLRPRPLCCLPLIEAFESMRKPRVSRASESGSDGTRTRDLRRDRPAF